MNDKVFRFGVVGFSATAIDFVAYTLLSLVVPTWIAKSIGFATGTITGFLLNRAWAFRYKGPSSAALLRYLLLYIATLFVNVFVNQLMLAVLASLAGVKFISFAAATLVSATINYFVMNKYIFVSEAK